MAVAHDDGHARPGEALLGEEGVADPIAADVEEVADALAPGPVAQDLALLGGLGILGGAHVIYDGLDPERVEDPVHTLLDEVRDGDRRGDLMAEDRVQLEDIDLSKGPLDEVGVEDFPRDCLSHVGLLSVLGLETLGGGHDPESPQGSVA